MLPANDQQAGWFAEWLAEFAARMKKMVPSWLSLGVSINRLYHSTIANRTTADVGAALVTPNPSLICRPTTGWHLRANAPNKASPKGQRSYEFDPALCGALASP